MFNKLSNWTYEQWLNSDARRLFNQIPTNVVEWVYSEDMTDEEKSEYPTHETTGGHLKILDETDSATRWWNSLTGEEKETIMNIPNFDAEIFRQCTGISVKEF